MSFSLIEVKSALDEILVTVPKDYVYEQPEGECYYVYKGAPSCLVGHVISHLGGELPHEDDEENQTRLKQTDMRNMFSDDAFEYLQRVQDAQDGLAPWHEAVKR